MLQAFSSNPSAERTGHVNTMQLYNAIILNKWSLKHNLINSPFQLERTDRAQVTIHNAIILLSIHQQFKERILSATLFFWPWALIGSVAESLGKRLKPADHHAAPALRNARIISLVATPWIRIPH